MRLIVVAARFLTGLAICAQEGAVGLALIQHAVQGGQYLGRGNAQLNVKIGHELGQTGVIVLMQDGLAESRQGFVRPADLHHRLTQNEEPGAWLFGDGGHLAVGNGGVLVETRDGGVSGGQCLEVVILAREELAGAFENRSGFGIELLAVDVNGGKLGRVRPAARETGAQALQHADRLRVIALRQGAARIPMPGDGPPRPDRQRDQQHKHYKRNHPAHHDDGQVLAQEITAVKLPGLAMVRADRQHFGDLLARLGPLALAGKLFRVLQEAFHAAAQALELGLMVCEFTAVFARGPRQPPPACQPRGIVLAHRKAQVEQIPFSVSNGAHKSLGRGLPAQPPH